MRLALCKSPSNEWCPSGSRRMAGSTDGKHINVGIYVRVACPQQARSALSAQKESLKRYCVCHGLTVTRCYCDAGTSGLLPMEQRSAGRRLLRDARLGRFDLLLVSATDRLGRDVRVVLGAVAQLHECGVLVRSTAEDLSETIAWAQLISGRMSALPFIEGSRRQGD